MSDNSKAWERPFFLAFPIIAILCVCVLSVSNADGAETSMVSIAPAEEWAQAMVTGNGRLGVMVYGRPTSERIIFNHERLYEPLYDHPVAPPKIAHALPELRRLLLAGKYTEARLYIKEQATMAGFPRMLWTDPYHPAMAMLIQQPAATDPTEYLRSTDFATGEVVVQWQSGGNEFARNTFVSRPEDVVVQQITSPSGARVSGTISLANQDRRSNKAQNESYHPPEIEIEDQWLAYRCKYKKSKRGYFSATRVLVDGGTAKAAEGELSFDAKRVLLFTRVVSVEDWQDTEELLRQTMASLEDLPADYQQLLDSHARVQHEQLPQVRLDLGGGALRKESNETLIAAQQANKDRIEPALLERLFTMGRFALHSSSGEWPPNLMGIYNGNWRPEWSGDFTLDANLNLQISAANIGNVPTAMKSYSNLISSLEDDWRTNASNLLGCRGMVSGVRTDGRHNLNTHHNFHNWGFPGFYWTAGTEWLVLPMYEYYLVSGDRAFAEQTLLPLMKAIVDFYEDFLVETDSDGNFVFVPSHSPENWPGNFSETMVVNATMDIACAKEALTNLAALCRELEIEPDTVRRCEQMLERLPRYMVNEEGALQEWSWPGIKDRYNHRHVSHLYPVWPGHEINPEETPELFAAAKVAAHKRGRGNGSAHGLAHMALIGTRLKDAELVYENLLLMLRGNYLLPSMATYHNPNKIYNYDMLHSLPAVVLEMLVYSKPGEIELLPAVDERLAQGSLEGALCRGQVRVDKLSWDFPNKLVRVKLVSKIEQTIKLRLRRGMTECRLGQDGQLEIADNTVAEVHLLPEKPVEISIRLAE